MSDTDIKRILDMRFHRNGISGLGAVVSLFETRDGTAYLATTVTPSMCDNDLTPSGFDIERKGERQAYINQWLDAFAIRTVVVEIADPTQPKRGADLWGLPLAREWRERCVTAENLWSRYDPALEWYEHVHADPDEVARLVAEGNAATEELLGLPKGALS